MVLRDFTITNRLGLHARPSAKLTQLAGQFVSDIWITRAGRRVNAKSIMGVLMLAAGQGAVLSFEAHGEDAQQALDALGALIASGFDED
ncbi:MAG TPA: HPr family phosphocarrier protein [Burkholderiaceae bacterium]|nr:HPr family phosphocarrier protein [Burkholderiaceae bacterium]